MCAFESRHRVLFTEEQVRAGIRNVAEEISEDFVGQDIVLVGILKGAYYFLTHLATEIVRVGSIRACRIEFLGVSSYGDAQMAGEIHIESDLRRPVKGENVILIDDVAETRQTLAKVTTLLRMKEPKCIRVAVLFNKPEKAMCDLHLDYIALGRENAGWIYGCGMDTKGCYRALPFIAVADANGDPQPNANAEVPAST